VHRDGKETPELLRVKRAKRGRAIGRPDGKIGGDDWLEKTMIRQRGRELKEKKKKRDKPPSRKEKGGLRNVVGEAKTVSGPPKIRRNNWQDKPREEFKKRQGERKNKPCQGINRKRDQTESPVYKRRSPKKPTGKKYKKGRGKGKPQVTSGKTIKSSTARVPELHAKKCSDGQEIGEKRSKRRWKGGQSRE